jgi:uncharacterized membrane protein
MKPSRTLKIVAAMVLVFVAGGLAGSFITILRIHRAFEKSLQFENWAADTEAKLSRKLSLSPDQRSKTRIIIGDMETEFRSIFSRTFRESAELLVRSGKNLDTLLTPEQRAIHAEMKAELRRNLKRDLKLDLPPE